MVSMTVVQEAPRTRQIDGGLRLDLPLLRRRRMMGLAGGTTVAVLAGTPAPAGPCVLTRSGIVRSDIRRGFGTASGVARGVPLTIRLRLESTRSGAPLTGLAVYLWQADAQGRYSLHTEELAGQNYLRGVQATDEAGWVTFTSIFPGIEPGHRPHLHFEVYPGVAEATETTGELLTGRLTLPEDVCRQAYGNPAYAGSKSNLARSSRTTDAFAGPDGPLMMAAVTGDVRRGFTASRSVRL